MNKASLCLAALCCTLVLACSGSSESGKSAVMDAQRIPALKQGAANYGSTVQALYVAYFGRPADPTGLANFENALVAAGAPADIQGFARAYTTNSAVKSLVDAFGTSKESQTLYGGGTTANFATAVFINVLGRPPQAAGLNYWTTAIDSGTLSQGNAAMAIMAGALANTTTQGLLDAQLINNRLAVAAAYTAEVASLNATSNYSGQNAAANARSVLASVTAATSVSAFDGNLAAYVQTLAPGSGPAIVATSASSALPLTPLTLQIVNVSGSGAITVNFSDSSGFSVSNSPIRTGASGALVIAVPLYFNSASGAIGAGNVNVSITQNGQTSATVPLAIEDLPQSSSYGASLGDISRQFLVYKALAFGSNLNGMTNAMALTGIDTTAAQTSLQSAVEDAIHARLDVDQIAADTSTTLSWGTAPDGTPLNFSAADLDMMDRILGVYLQQVFSGTAQANMAHQPRHKRVRAFVRLGLGHQASVKLVGHRHLGVGSLSQWLQNLADAGTVTNSMVSVSTSQGFFDASAAVTSGAAPFLGNPLWTKVSGILGAVTGVTQINNSINAYFDNFSAVTNCATDFSSDCTSEVQAFQNSALQIVNAEIQTLSNIPSIVGTGSALTNLINSGVSLASNLAAAYNNYQNTGTTGSGLLNLLAGAFSSVAPSLSGAGNGLAGLDGGATITYTSSGSGQSDPQYGISACCFGLNSTTLQGVTDLLGNFSLQIPVGLSNTDYTNINFGVNDFTSGDILAQLLANLGGLTSGGTFSLNQTLTGTCNDPDNDVYDDPDCD